ncbi:MAG: ATP-binding protein [Bacteroidales bacterium]|nr:ATP-binding protein [Bacteroidales bacterium]
MSHSYFKKSEKFVNIAIMNVSDIGIKEIDQMVQHRLPLSPSLYFIDSKWWTYLISEKEEKLLKLISALANHNGRVLIIGIKTKNKRASEIDSFSLHNFSEFWLRNLIHSQINPHLDNIVIKPIITNGENGIVVVSFSSNKRPYMFSDGRYYSIIGQQVYCMREDEVRRLYAIQHTPLLEFVGIMNIQGISMLENGLPKEINFYPKFIIRNAGNAIEKNYKVEIWIPSYLHDPEFSPLQMYFHRLDNIYSVFSIPSKAPIFQNETYTIAEAKLSLKPDYVDRFVHDSLIVRIFYSKGIAEHEYKLAQTFTYNSKPVELKIFLQNL